MKPELESLTRIGSLPCNIIPIATEQRRNMYQTMAQKLDALCLKAGRGSGFELRRRELRTAAEAGRDIRTVMDRTAYLRPLIDLWKTDNDFLEDIPPTAALLTHIDTLVQETPYGRMPRLALRELCMLFYTRYDTLPDVGLVGAFVCRQLDSYEERELKSGLDMLHRYRRQMLTPRGHEFLASLAQQRGRTLPDAAKAFGIPDLDSQLYTRSVQVYYIERLKALPVNAEDPLLNEVRNRTLCSQYMDRPLRFGHMVLRVLIDKLRHAGEKPSQPWMDTLLTIGGDPRLPRESQSFRTWWQPLTEERINAMYEWLSEQDLELFLKICREYSIQSSQEAMRRMYPDREYFLRGLFRKKLIRQTRLYLGSNVQAYVDRTFQGKKKPMTTKISGNGELAAFYLSLTSSRHGSVHMVEGTHNFAVTIMDRIPPGSVLASWRDEVPARSLGRGLEEDYEMAFPGSRRIFRIIHTASGKWKYDAVQALRDLGVNVVESDVISRQDYYTRRY